MEKQTKESPLSNNSNRKLRKVVPSKDKIEDNIQKQTKQTKCRFAIVDGVKVLKNSVFYEGYLKGRTQAISEFKEKLKKRLGLEDKDCIDDMVRAEIARVIEKTAQEIK
jgi:hypothetical protein